MAILNHTTANTPTPTPSNGHSRIPILEDESVLSMEVKLDQLNDFDWNDGTSKPIEMMDLLLNCTSFFFQFSSN